MGDSTNISWTDMTWSPWVGCARVSPACDGCYAAQLMENRFGRAIWGGPGKGAGTRSRTSPSNWKKPLAWDRRAAQAGSRPFVFCSSLADVFDNQVPDEWRADLFELIRKTPNLVWLLLTKRPQNIVKLSTSAGGLPCNAAIGTTVEDQTRFDQNVPALRKAKEIVSPAFAFLSCEPLLGSLSGDMSGVDWVITGGETDQGAHKARPSNPQWFRDLRDQCSSLGIPFHHKQNGEWVSVSEVAGDGPHFKFDDGRTVRRIGKHKTGRTIDGVEHNGFPAIRTAA